MHGVYIGNRRMLCQLSWGCKLIVPADDLSLMPEIVIKGVLELPLSAYLIKTVKPGNVLIDAGANIGYFTVLMGALCGPTGKVIAYEANPHLYSIIMDNLSINYLHDRVAVYNKAVYSKNTTINFYLSSRFLGNSSIYRHSEEYHKHYQDEIQKVEIEAESLDKLIGEFTHIDIIKIDIEGGEYHALLGMREMINNGTVGTVIFELNKTMLQQDYKLLKNFLNNLSRSKENIKFFNINNNGELVGTSVEKLFFQESCAHVVMQCNSND
ncbi:FkbM family methyltransferase [Desulfolucanica intricata]|uniref:FkbM family methyltransferase n=1 Tax=Desulfolucanica intricata TaxID=1285191 RepID=UPI00082F785F|nr:FkbM family methyltransferase [Desulfolucanica intricata]